MNIATLRRARGRDMGAHDSRYSVRENSEIPYKTSFQKENFRRAARALCFIKVQRSTGREILTAKSRVAEKHSFMFTCFAHIEFGELTQLQQWKSSHRGRFGCANGI